MNVIYGLIIILLSAAIVLQLFIKVIAPILIYVLNKQCPVRTLNAKIIDKRSDVYKSPLRGNYFVKTDYFCTFELHNGERKEFEIRSNYFGLLAQGDTGVLTYQGSKFKMFQRSQAQ